MNHEAVSDKSGMIAPGKRLLRGSVSQSRLIAGINLPDGPLIVAAIEYAQRLSEPYLFNHAMRSWLFAETLGRVKGIDYDREVVAMLRSMREDRHQAPTS